MGAANLAAAAAFAASGGVPPHMITPELQRLQKQQMELQRLHMASMNQSAATFGHQSFDAKKHSEAMFAAGGLDNMSSKKIRLSDSDDDLIANNDDDGNASISEIENQSGRDEASSGSPSIERLGGGMGLGLGGGGRKRKSRNPTRINLANMMDDEESKNKTVVDNQGNYQDISL